MTEHIMASDIVKQIRAKNKERMLVYREEIGDALAKIKEKAEQEEKGDVVVYTFSYIRVGNDILTSFSGNHETHTWITGTDLADARCSCLSRMSSLYEEDNQD